MTESMAAASPSVNSTPARYWGDLVAFGSSNLAHATAPRKRSRNSSLGSVIRTF
jgi:hypothetical protein